MFAKLRKLLTGRNEYDEIKSLPVELERVAQELEGIQTIDQLELLYGLDYSQTSVNATINAYGTPETNFLIKGMKTLRDFNCEKIEWVHEGLLISVYVWKIWVIGHFTHPIEKPPDQEVEGHL